MDLSTFQFDFDLTFAAFFMNPDGTIYGRFGSRSNREEAMKDISIDGFRKAIAGAIALHREYPRNKTSLLGKKGKPLRFAHPEQYPSLSPDFRSSLDEEKPAESCIHCHMVSDAERLMVRTSRKPIPEELLYLWPMPDVIGLTMDTAEKARIVAVESGSPAADGGFKPGDEIVKLAGQPIISIADIQWILHNSLKPQKLNALVLRAGKKVDLSLTLDSDWRKRDDIAWRASTWDLRRMALGGLLLEAMPPSDRRKANIADGSMALRVKHVGEYGEHAVAMRAGVLKDDIVIAIEGVSDQMSETGAIAFLLQRKMPGEVANLRLLRGKTQIDVKLQMQ